MSSTGQGNCRQPLPPPWQFFPTVEWRNLQRDGERARAYFDEWRGKNCLKTLDDFQRWQVHYQFAGARAKRQKNGGRGPGINATAEDAVGLARRGVLRLRLISSWFGRQGRNQLT